MIGIQMDPGTDRAWAGDVACCGVNNRGVALWKNKVISIALDGRMFAINKATGEVVWERKIADPANAEVLTIAPLVIRDMAIVGTAGGEFGIRGFIEATDLNTGKALWRTYTIPGAGEPGNETWKDGKDRWKHGGGSVWETATYDPEADTFYEGIGNAGPDWDAEYRPGDNKWAASVLAINASLTPALILPACNIEAMNPHLVEIAAALHLSSAAPPPLRRQNPTEEPGA